MTHPLYLIEADFGRIGRAFIETDRDSNSRAHAIELIRSGEVNPIKVLEVCEDEGTLPRRYRRAGRRGRAVEASEARDDRSRRVHQHFQSSHNAYD